MENQTPPQYSEKISNLFRHSAAWTLGLMAAVIPLIVRRVDLPMGPDINALLTTLSNNMDVFAYYKSILILVGSALLLAEVILLVFASRKWGGVFRFLVRPMNSAAVFYLALAIVSSVFSPYTYTVLHGISERFESIFIIVGYFVIFFAAQSCVPTPAHVKPILYGVLFSGIVIGILAALPFFGVDFFTTSLSGWLVFGPNQNMFLGHPNGGPTSAVTLYNPNNVGSYAALLLPMAGVSFLYCRDNKPLRIMFLILTILMAFTAVGSNSSGGYAGLAFAFLVFIAVAAVRWWKAGRRIHILSVVCCTAALVVVMAAVWFVPHLRTRAAAVYKKFTQVERPDNFIRDLQILDSSRVVVQTANGNISFNYTPYGELLVSDSQNIAVTPGRFDVSEKDQITHATYQIPNMPPVVCVINPSGFSADVGGVMFYFLRDEYNKIFMLNRRLLPIVDLNASVQSIGFDGMEAWASNRGYIWSRTFPLMIRRPWLGSGPDTFLLVFPQNDILSKVRLFGDPYIMIDKAHNFFFQTAVNTGLISMLAMMFMFLYFITTTCRLIIKGKPEAEPSWMFALRFGLAVGVSGYMVACCATDSIVGIAPVFWMLLGLGTALNRLSQAPAGGDIK